MQMVRSHDGCAACIAVKSVPLAHKGAQMDQWELSMGEVHKV